MTAADATLVVPCYAEEHRLQPQVFLRLAEDVRLIFVDGASPDGTFAALEALCRRIPQRARVLRLPDNRGKGETVRTGLRVALDEGATTVGYFDADLATPAAEMMRLVRLLAGSPARVALAVRRRLPGHDIRRSLGRRVLGRVFASSASLVVGTPIYDTQCGAKLFRCPVELHAAVAEPFLSRWAFDVELLGRLLLAGLRPDEILEVPLRAWADVGGSKLRPADMLRAGLDLGRIAVDLRRRRS